MTQTAVGGSTRNDLGHLRVLDSAAVAEIPWERLRDLDGVEHKILWQAGDVTIGMIRVAAGATKPGHVHFGAHHHILMMAGTCTMVGQRLDPGSYAYIPPGVEHEVTDVGADGCTFFYTYRPLERPATDPQIAGSAHLAE